MKQDIREFLNGMQEEKPAFPLEEETVIVALEKSGLPGILSESETTSWAEGQRTHVVRSPDITYSDAISIEDEEQVYQAFAGKELPDDENVFERWDAGLPEGYCTVTYRISEETSNPKQKRHTLMV